MIKPESAFVLIRKWASAIDEAGKESEKQPTSQLKSFGKCAWPAKASPDRKMPTCKTELQIDRAMSAILPLHSLRL